MYNLSKLHSSCIVEARVGADARRHLGGRYCLCICGRFTQVHADGKEKRGGKKRAECLLCYTWEQMERDKTKAESFGDGMKEQEEMRNGRQ